MKWIQKYRGIIVEVIGILFIILFVYAGLTKLIEGNNFYNTILNSPILGGRTMASLGAWLVPLLELAVALLIAWPRTKIKGLYGALALMLLFTGYTAAILFLAPYIPCSCGGVISLLSWEQHLVFNMVFLLLAVVGIGLLRRDQKKKREMEGFKVS